MYVFGEEAIYLLSEPFMPPDEIDKEQREKVFLFSIKV